jgi:hypothetical protein
LASLSEIKGKLKDMKWLEIIELRKGSYKDQELQNVFKQLVKELRFSSEYHKIKVYHNYDVDCDYSIHLAYDQVQPDACGSELGMRIASILKTFGLVSHNVWIEQKNNLLQVHQIQKDKHINSSENE